MPSQSLPSAAGSRDRQSTPTKEIFPVKANGVNDNAAAVTIVTETMVAAASSVPGIVLTTFCEFALFILTITL